MNNKKINFLINFELFFDIKALYTSAIRVINQKYNFLDNQSLNQPRTDTATLINNLKIENNVKRKIEQLIKDNVLTLKPKLYFLMNIMSLVQFFNKKNTTSMIIYYDNKLLLNEEEHEPFFSYMKTLISIK